MKDKIQGEGDKDAARNYNESTQNFFDSTDVEEKARTAGDVTDAERDAMKRAEQAGKARARAEDPDGSNESDA